ncbi:MAG: hypothetical protein HY577_01325, partial [Candidatus Nealsonbacteria bacterium]|nr:hypothetical protein [Candidatus Nealsonbacteria bacterium]
MENFDLNKSAIVEAVRLVGGSGFRLTSLFRKVFQLLFLLFSSIFLYGFLTNALAVGSLSRLLGAGIISLSLSAIFWQLDLFVELKLKKPKLKVALPEALANPDNFNPADFLGFEAAVVVERALRIARKKKVHLNTGLILFSLISDSSPLISFVLARLLINREEMRPTVEKDLDLPRPDEAADLANLW